MTLCSIFVIFLHLYFTGHFTYADKTEEIRPLLLFADPLEIDAVELDTWTNITITHGLHNARSVDYHYEKGLIFWTDAQDRHISVTGVENNFLRKNEAIVKTKMGSSYGMAVDWINDHIYWTDATFQSIQVVNLQGGNRRTLIDYLIEKPMCIAVHPSDGILFFSDWGTYPRIERCGLDGKDRETIVENVGEPISLTIDYKVKRIYWLDRLRSEIKSAKFDGSSIKTVMKNSNYLSEVYGIAIHKDKVYWTNWGKGEILRTDKYASFEVEKVFASSAKVPYGLVLYDGNQQMTLAASHCAPKNGGCSHLCLPSAPWSDNILGYTCTCSDGYVLGKDKKTCSYNGRNVKVLLAEKGTISSTDIDSGHRELLQGAASSNIVGIDYDYDQQMMFWTDHYNNNIYAYFLFFNDKPTAGFGLKSLLPEFVYKPDSIAVDWIYKHIYWTDLRDRNIHVCTFYGTYRKTFVIKDLVYPYALALSPSDGLMFFSDYSSLFSGTISRSAMDGSEKKTIIKNRVLMVCGIAVDHLGRRIYWTDVGLQTIQSATFDGTDVHTVKLFTSPKYLPSPYGIDVFGDLIYWTNRIDRSVFTAHKYTGKNMAPFLTDLDNPKHIKIISKESQQEGTNRCGENNGKCDHLCLPVPVTQLTPNGYSCVCSDDFLLEDDVYCIRKDIAELVKDEL
ncbi:low-density lipoprotein receptor-related protein 4-like isoform X1 [Mytilus edulis]|uniref:low-density lipoprotein receptor-related protein 4-like isoform X1 n=1 Tax=Mytilus edulis TaxID=6550 RepID=UPI0039EED7FC